MRIGKRALWAAPLLLVALLTTACVPMKPYRGNEAAATDAACATDDDSKPLKCPSVIVNANPDYTLGILEFDDQGTAYNPDQTDFVLGKLAQEDAAGTAPHDGKIVIVFAHGWFHNASPDDQNLKFFREMLRLTATVETARAKADKRKARRVQGVFLAWRGASSNLPLLKLATFWNRKDAAHRIGERQATEALVKIRDAAYAAPSHTPGYPNRFIIMGHSFGGALVYSAISQLMADELLESGHPGGPQVPLADAMILFNPAFEAARVQHLFETASSLERRYPKLTIFTSKSDAATGRAFPIARFINTLLLSYRNDVVNPLKPTQTLSQRTEDTRTIGHFEPFITHDLVRAGEQPDNPCRVKPALVFPQLDTVEDEPESAQKDQQQHAIANVADEAYRTLTKAYQDPKTKLLEFGKTCLVIRPGLVRNQLAVFNVSMDADLWDGHGINQTEERADTFLRFLQKFIPFAATGSAEAAEAGARDLQRPAAAAPSPNREPRF